MSDDLTSIPNQPNKSFVKQTEGEVREVKPVKKEVRRPLKPRDTRFIKAKAENPDIPNYKAAMIATGTDDMATANVQAQRMLQNVSLREALEEALQRQGFTIDSGAKALNDALKANKSTQGAVVEDGERVSIGLIETDIPDHAIRVNAAKTIFAFLQDKSEPEKNTFNFKLNVNNGQQNFVKNEQQ